MSVVSESADSEFEMDSRRGDLLGQKTSSPISCCCSLVSPLYFLFVGYGDRYDRYSSSLLRVASIKECKN